MEQQKSINNQAIQNKKYPFIVRLLFLYQIKKYGKVLNPIFYWSFIPYAMFNFLSLIKFFNRKRTTIEPTLKSLISIRVSQINHCSFCVDFNEYNFLNMKGLKDKIDFLERYENSELFSQQEKLSLRYAEEITYSDKTVSKNTRNELNNFFSYDAIVELTAWICIQNLSSKFNEALDIEPQGFCDITKKKEKTN